MIANDNVKPRHLYTAADHEALADIERITDELAAKIARDVLEKIMMDDQAMGSETIYVHIDPMIDAMADDPRASARDLGILRERLYLAVCKHGKEITHLHAFEGGRA